MQKNHPQFNSFCFFIFFFFTVFSYSQGLGAGQTSNSTYIKITSVTTPVCVGNNVIITFDAKNGKTTNTNDHFTNSTNYTVQISNNGFTTSSNITPFQTTLNPSNSTYSEIDNGVTVGISTTATIPSDLTPGANYKIRIISTSPNLVYYSPSDSFTVNASPAQPTITAGGPLTFCAGGSVTLTSSAGTSYLWSTGATTASISPSVVGTYTVRVTNAAGCQSVASAGTTVLVNPLPTPPTIGAITQPTCATATGSVVLSNLPAGNWTINPGAIAGNVTSTTISGLASGTYNYTVTNSNGCTSSPSASVVISPTKNYWTGASSVWDDPANWSIGVPNDSNDLINIIPVIPDVTKYYPVITFGMGVAATSTTGPGVFVKNLEIQKDALLTVYDNSLNVTTCALTLNGKIDLNNESQLLQWDGSTFVGTGSIEIDQQGTGNSFRYNYWSSPVNSRGTKFTIDEVLRGGDGIGSLTVKNITYGPAYAFAEADVDSSPIKLSTYWMYVLRNSGAGYAAWYRVGNTSEVSVGEGYTMKGSNTSAALQNYTFVGAPNNGDITLPLNGGFDYLVGNPYPSALNAAQFLWDNQNSIESGAIYFWEHYGGDTHNLAGYQAGYAARNVTGGSPASSPSSVSNVVASDVIKKIPGPSIAVGQAFFVIGDTDGGNIVFMNSQREFIKESSGNSIFMKTSSSKAKTTNIEGEDFRPRFRIGFDAPKISHRQLLLGVDERATKAVDWGFDAEIYEIFADDMYWMLDGKKYVIQGTNAVGLNSEVPLGIQLSKTGMVTVKIDALENVDDDTTIYLKDKITGESFNMREKPVQLNLMAGKYADRFVLIFKTQKLLAEEINAEILIPAATQSIIEGIHVYMNNAIGELQIKNNSTKEITNVALINAVGQTIKTWNSNFNIRTISLPLSTATGVYLVQINTKIGKTVKKISVE